VCLLRAPPISSAAGAATCLPAAQRSSTATSPSPPSSSAVTPANSPRPSSTSTSPAASPTSPWPTPSSARARRTTSATPTSTPPTSASVYQTLLKPTPAPPQRPNNTVIDIPGLYTDKDPQTGATLTDKGDNTAGIATSCITLDQYDLFVQYSWPLTSQDLDTNTEFLGVSTGFSGANTSPYVTWSGDNTSGGGIESATINLYQAYLDRQIFLTPEVTAHAGWFEPSQGSGPATLTVAFKNKETGELARSTIKTISPGHQTSLAEQLVSTIKLTINQEDLTVSFELA
jgi:hypothetical protein